MNLDQLKAFHQVAATGSFTKASRILFITQPAVSQQVQALESYFGITLFDRSGKKVMLTSEGEILLTYTANLFRHYNEIEELFGQMQKLKMGKITIGATAVMGTYFLPGMIGRYNKRYPGIDIDVRMGNSHKIMNSLLEGEGDIGFAGRIKVNPRLEAIPIHREKLLVVSAPDNPLANKKVVFPTELGKIPFIWREKGTITRELVKGWFEKSVGRKYPHKSIELQNLEAAKRTVLEGYGITVIPEISVRREIHLGLLKPVNLKGFDLFSDYYLFYLKGRTFSKASLAFFEMLAGYKRLSDWVGLSDHLEALSASK
jgi:DNA-binding transcriptional LysR family regulator